MINCKEIANYRKLEIRDTVKELELKGKRLGLAIIQVGSNPASERYISGKTKDCEEVGIMTHLFKFKENVSQDDLLDFIRNLNNNNKVDGIIVQLPLPKHINKEIIVNSISVHKDVDGFIKESKFIPCTPKGVLTILDEIGVDLKSKTITLVGYGELVNKPLMPILSNMGATVCVCRSNTTNQQLYNLCKLSDIIISAVGKNGIINDKCINVENKPIIIDCGIEVINGKQYGDCDVDLYNTVPFITPRVGGMGLMTRISLLENVVGSYCNINENITPECY